MNQLNLDNEAQELLTGTLRDGMLCLVLYIALWLLFEKIIKNQNLKAISIGVITPLFFYYSVGYLVYPLTLLLYILQIDSIGLLGGIIFGLLKPLSLLSGILVALYLLKEK